MRGAESNTNSYLDTALANDVYVGIVQKQRQPADKDLLPLKTRVL